MTTFDNFVKDKTNFFYQRGVVQTTTPWDRPTYQRIKEYFQTIKDSTEILNEYKFYLIGGVLFDMNKTWDVDIMLRGPVKNYELLEGYMNILYDIAFNQFKLLLDIQWLSDDLPNYTIEYLKNFEQESNKLRYIKLGYAKKVVGEEMSEIDLRTKEGVKKVSEYLIEGYYDILPKNRFLDRIVSNPNKKFVYQFDLDTFLSTDENYFFQNTNNI
jgi:hypothetical protein